MGVIWAKGKSVVKSNLPDPGFVHIVTTLIWPVCPCYGVFNKYASNNAVQKAKVHTPGLLIGPEIHKTMQNTAKFGRNLIKYMSVQQFWNLCPLLGVFTCRKLTNLCQNFVNNVPKLPGVDYVAKNWALAMMLKALPLVHFWSVLLLKQQMMTSVRKQNPLFFYLLLPSQVCPENSREICRFFRDLVPKNPAKFDFFPRPIRSPDIHIVLFLLNWKSMHASPSNKFHSILIFHSTFN